MPRKAKPAADVQARQDARAAELRKDIADRIAGIRPANSPPKTPREITDEAAERKWAAAKRRKKR
jgi:hypothetical protein